MRPPEEDDSKELHEMNPTGRFSVRAVNYARFRPDYPATAIDCLLEGLGAPASLVAADVGAGTGISSRLIADRGARVIAVEPNAAMREVAAPHPRVSWSEGTAEATGLERGSVNLVACAQAFHWFRQAEAVAEFHRVLTPHGRLALIWNKRDHEDPLTRGYIESIRAVGGEHPAETRTFDRAVVSAAGSFTPVTLATFTHEQRLDAEGFIEVFRAEQR